jgi:hypothetical protein
MSDQTSEAIAYIERECEDLKGRIEDQRRLGLLTNVARANCSQQWTDKRAGHMCRAACYAMTIIFPILPQAAFASSRRIDDSRARALRAFADRAAGVDGPCLPLHSR